jgi:hypothetical protein
MNFQVNPDTVTKYGSLINRSIYQGFNALEASGRELGRTAEFYQSHDQQSAARLDGAHPASPRPTIESPDSYRPLHLEGRAGPFAAGPGTDVADPLAFLTPPGKPHEFTDPVKLFNVVSDLISPSWWLNEIINDTVGANPLKVVRIGSLATGKALRGARWCGMTLARPSVRSVRTSSRA